MAQRALRRATTSLSVIACCCRRLNPLRRQRNLADLRCQDQVSYPKLLIQVRMTSLRRRQGASGEGQPAQASAIYTDRPASETGDIMRRLWYPVAHHAALATTRDEGALRQNISQSAQ